MPPSCVAGAAPVFVELADKEAREAACPAAIMPARTYQRMPDRNLSKATHGAREDILDGANQLRMVIRFCRHVLRLSL